MSEVVEYKLSELKTVVLLVAALNILSVSMVLLHMAAEPFGIVLGLAGTGLALATLGRQEDGQIRRFMGLFMEYSLRPLNEWRDDLKERGEL